jgi:hypothetical protein
MRITKPARRAMNFAMQARASHFWYSQEVREFLGDTVEEHANWCRCFTCDVNSNIWDPDSYLDNLTPFACGIKKEW